MASINVYKNDMKSATERNDDMLAEGQKQVVDAMNQDRDRKLRDMLQGKEQSFKTSEAMRQKQEIEAMRQANPKAALRVGDYSINPEPQDSLRNMLRHLTPAQESAERLAGKQITDYEASGGKPNVEKNLQALSDVKDDIANRSVYDRVVGGALNGFPTLMGLFNPSEKARRDKVRSVANNLARQSDPNPTEQQVNAIQGQVYDSASDNAANQDRVDRFYKEQQGKAAQMEQAAQNYNSTGYVTLGGVHKGQPATPGAAPQGAETPEQRYMRLKAKHGK